MYYKKCEDYNNGKCQTAINELKRYEQILTLYEEDKELEQAKMDFEYLLVCNKGKDICCCECNERENCGQQCVEYDCEEL